MPRLIIPVTVWAILSATSFADEPSELPLWPNGAPGLLDENPANIPRMQAYLPDPAKATGAAMIVLPGGSYAAWAKPEGAGYAAWLNEHGIAAFVVKYRRGTHGYHHPIQLGDAARALRTVRAGAEKWHLDPARIGIIGSSAGGHLASTLLTHFDAGDPNSPDPIDRISSRPDLGVLCYAVISMGPNTHQKSKENLLGPNPSQELIDLLSNEKQVTAQTPPCFIWHTWEDNAVKVENSLAFAQALREKSVPFDLHIYQQGKHGIGLGKDPAVQHPWAAECINWLRIYSFVK